MAKRERVWECAHATCDAYLVEGRGDSLGWQEVRARRLKTLDRPELLALCPEHALVLSGEIGGVE